MKAKTIHVIEISAGSVKLASFQSSGKNRILLKSLFIQTYDSRPKMEEILKQAAQAISEKHAVFGTSVWAATMMTRKVVMNLDSADSVKETLNLEAEKYVPFPIAECLVDGYVIRELENGNQSDVMLVASKKDLIFERCELLKKSGIQLRYMEVHPVAMSNLYDHLAVEGVGKPVALVHLGDVPGTVSGEENFASVCFEGKPAVIRDLGSKLSEPGAGDAQWRYVVTQVANAVSFFENSMKVKVEEFRVGGEEKTCAEFIQRYQEHANSAFVRWSIMDRLDFDNEEIKQLAFQHEAAVTMLLSIGCRKFT